MDHRRSLRQLVWMNPEMMGVGQPTRDSVWGEENRSYELLKRMMDTLIALLMIPFVLPLCLIIAIVLWLSSPGPLLFRQKRLGRYGREFWCLKFRTMVPNAEALLNEREDLREQYRDGFKIKNDPRVTPLGAFLRRTSLDELPQFWNVLKGDISLIGPRPIVPPELEKYGFYAERLLMVKPGLSGMWQVSGRSETTYSERVQMDMDYIAHRSLLLDLRLLACTARAVLMRRGAC